MIIFGLAVGPMVGTVAGDVTPPAFAVPSTIIGWVFANIAIVLLSLLSSSFLVPYPAFFVFGGWTLVSFLINAVLLK